jgi:hypothetical protein
MACAAKQGLPSALTFFFYGKEQVKSLSSGEFKAGEPLAMF